jgi:hypothetical protein
MARHFGAALQCLDEAACDCVIGVSTQIFDGRRSDAP